MREFPKFSCASNNIANKHVNNAENSNKLLVCAVTTSRRANSALKFDVTRVLLVDCLVVTVGVINIYVSKQIFESFIPSRDHVDLPFLINSFHQNRVK